MTEKANPSINRPAEAFKTAGAIAYGGADEGFVVEANSPTPISVQDSGITDENLNAFDETSSASSLDVTIDGGEAFVFGAWVAIDTQTTVTLAASTNGQTVSVGWNKNGADDVIVGLGSAFSSASGDADQKIPLWEFDTDGSGVTSVTDLRSFDQISADSIEQGVGSGLDADTVDGVEADQLGGGDIANDGSVVTSSTDEIDFTTGITASDDGDGTSTVELTADHSDLSNIGTDDHHTKYTDSEAVSAVNAETTLTVDISGDADTLDGEDATSFVGVSGDTMSGDLSFEDDIRTLFGSDTDFSIQYVSADDELKIIDETNGVVKMVFDKNGDVFIPNGDLDLGGTNTITNLAEPVNSTDVATKSFTESVAQGLTLKDSVRVSNHDQNIDLTSSTDPNPIDNVTLDDGDRILLKHQTDLSENGIYDAVTATDPTTWVRSPDFNEDEEVVQGAFTFVREGTHANESYVVISPDPITVGTDNIEFAQFAAAGELLAGDNLQKDGDTLNVIGGSGSGLDADTVDGIQGSDISSIYASVTTETGAYTASDGDLVLADASSSGFTVTLPSPNAGDVVTVKKIDSSANAVTIATPDAETIDGHSTITISAQFASRDFVSDGTNYFMV